MTAFTMVQCYSLDPSTHAVRQLVDLCVARKDSTKLAKTALMLSIGLAETLAKFFEGQLDTIVFQNTKHIDNGQIPASSSISRSLFARNRN